MKKIPQMSAMSLSFLPTGSQWEQVFFVFVSIAQIKQLRKTFTNLCVREIIKSVSRICTISIIAPSQQTTTLSTGKEGEGRHNEINALDFYLWRPTHKS